MCRSQALGKEVMLDAEHFFDGYKANSQYALAALRTAAEAGADVVVLCDTNGGSMPWQVEVSGYGPFRAADCYAFSLCKPRLAPRFTRNLETATFG